jgi:hypothetical protein
MILEIVVNYSLLKGCAAIFKYQVSNLSLDWIINRLLLAFKLSMKCTLEWRVNLYLIIDL